MENVNKNIGEEGDIGLFSYASRAMNREPDIEQIKKYDTSQAARNPLFYVVILLSLILLSGGVILFMNGHWIWGSIVLLIFLISLLFLRSFSNPLLTKRIAYESGLIIPGIIVQLEPLHVVTMADMRSSEDGLPIYGLKKHLFPSLPMHELKVGEKVPCVALFGISVKGYRRHYDARPIVWGFSDQSLMQSASQQIDEMVSLEDANPINEWQLLAASSQKFNSKLNIDGDILMMSHKMEEVNI